MSGVEFNNVKLSSEELIKIFRVLTNFWVDKLQQDQDQDYEQDQKSDQGPFYDRVCKNCGNHLRGLQADIGNKIRIIIERA